jgi:hypothetical protein
MERCPNCRASYRDGTECRRCGMDLSQLLAVERAADSLFREALARLGAGDVRAATAALSRASTLRRDPFLDLMSGFARSVTEAPSFVSEAAPVAATSLDVWSPG